MCLETSKEDIKKEGIEEKSVKGENSRHSTSVEAAKYKS
jgi:hypothetical protein